MNIRIRMNEALNRLEALKRASFPNTAQGVLRHDREVAETRALAYNLGLLAYMEANPKLPERVARKEHAKNWRMF